jgi:aminoglycoside 2'-N-acetyltransferase I
LADFTEVSEAAGISPKNDMPLQSPVPPVSVEVRVVDSYSRADRSELAGGEEDPNQTSAYQLQWRPTEKHVLILEGGRKVCHVGLVKHCVAVEGHPVPIAGIGGVLTRPECRGRGYARVAMETAEAFALSQMGVDFMLLFCRPALQNWYEGLGWVKVPSAVWIEQQQGTTVQPLVSMVRCLGAKPWPQGEVRLGCLPW